MEQSHPPKNTTIRQTAMEQKRSRILQSARELFSSQGIERTSMEQIAAGAGIGPATLYRYFPTKTILASQVAIRFWQDLKERYLPSVQSDCFSALSGKEQLREILLLFVTLYEEHTGFLRFLSDFDSYLKSCSCTREPLSDYEDIIYSLKEYAQQSIEKGLSDKSLHADATVDEIYFTVFHCMLSMTQKMALQGDLLDMDTLVSGKRQLLLAVDLLLGGLSLP